MTKPLRATMPIVAAWIDQMRSAFSAEEINAAIKAGMNGQPTFYARENGIEVGTRYHAPESRTVALADIQIGPMFAAVKNIRSK